MHIQFWLPLDRRNNAETNYKTHIDEDSQSHNLLLNVAKTIEIIFDSRYTDITHEHFIINIIDLRENF